MRKLIRITIFCAIATFILLILFRFFGIGESKTALRVASKITKSAKTSVTKLDKKLNKKLEMLNGELDNEQAAKDTPKETIEVAKQEDIGMQEKELPIEPMEVKPSIEPTKKPLEEIKPQTKVTTSTSKTKLPGKVDTNLGLRQRMLEAEARRLEQELKLAPSKKPNQAPAQVKAPPVVTPTPAITPKPIAQPTPTTTPTPTPSVATEKPIKRVASATNQTSFEDIKRIIDSYQIPNIDSEELSNIIIIESHNNGIDPLLTTAIIYLESTFNRYAKSKTGKVGLMQIYPNDAKEITKKLNLPYLGDITLLHPLYNIKLGLYKLKKLMKDSNGNLETAIKKYSEVSSATKAETDLTSNDYVRKIIQITAGYRNRLKK